MISLLLTFALLTTEPIRVSFFDEKCVMEASYAAEQVHLSKDGVVTLYFEDGSHMNVPLKYTEEMQVRFGAFLRAYSWVNNRVKESTIPKCGGSV